MATGAAGESRAPRVSEPANDPVAMLRERLLDREEQLRTAQEMAEFGIWEWDVQAGTVEWSDELHAVYGTSPETHEPSYKAYLERVHPDDRERVAATIERAHADHEAFEFEERIVRPDGTIRTLHSRGRVVVDPENNIVRMIGVSQDVTEMHAAHADVREAAAGLAEAQSVARMGSWSWDIPNDVVTWSDELYRIYGADPETFDASYEGYLERVHPDDRDRVDSMVRLAFANAGDFSFEHRLVRPDGEVRLLEAHGRTITDDQGKVIRMVGTGRDITGQRETQEKAAAASVAIELAQRLKNLQRITEAALAHLSLEDLLPELLIRVCATLDVENAAVMLMDDDGETLELRAARGLGAAEIGFRVAVGGGFSGRVAAERKTVVIGEGAYESVLSPALREAGLETMVGVPLIVRNDVLGVLHIGSLMPRTFTRDEIALLELAGERAAMAIDHARVFEHERSIAETLQRALLPAKLPELEGMSAAVRYVPAAEGTEIGGDWYDVIRLDDGRVGLVLGDVTGHGIEAAALMAQLRHSLRAYALDGLPPADVAERLDRLIHTPDLERLATLIYAVVAPDLTIEYVSAGHPPPLVARDSGETRMLDNPGGLPIGCQTGDGYHTQYAKLDPDETLILYTDGLVERRGESIDAGLRRLRDAAAHGPDDAEDLADHLIRTLLPLAGGEDDIALLTLRPTPVPASRAV